MLPASKTLPRRTVLGAAAIIGVGALVRPARAQAPKFKTVEDGYITIAMRRRPCRHGPAGRHSRRQ